MEFPEDLIGGRLELPVFRHLEVERAAVHAPPRAKSAEFQAPRVTVDVALVITGVVRQCESAGDQALFAGVKR